MCVYKRLVMWRYVDGVNNGMDGFYVLWINVFCWSI